METSLGTVGGRYRLEAELGKGGMGAVYWATDLRTNESVALKRIITKKRKRHSPKPVLRFQREFHTLASLRHPRIIRAFDYGVDSLGPYYTMELLKGDDLQEVMKGRGCLPPDETCRLMRDIASALAALHARGLIHRDLSSRNVRVIDGRATLFDFGVLVNAGWVGDVAGTPAYTAPEMVRGVPVDGRADLYSLGVLGYRMLTGRRPYDARSMNELEACWSVPVVPPSSVAQVPEGLEDLVLDLLCLEPLGRPPNAAVLIDRLTALGNLDPAPELAVSPGFTQSAAMVGRDQELKTLSTLFADAQGGESRSFMLEAESGAGKTRLLQELAIRTKLGGGLAVHVSCEEADGGPFAALAALVDEVFAAAPDETAAATAAAAPILGRVFESVRHAHPQVALEKELGEPAEDRMRLQAAVVSAVRALAASRPVVLLVDDIQRCDEASAAGFAGLAWAEIPGLLLGFARRLGEPVRAPAAVEALSTLEPRLRLGGLDQAGLEELLKSVFGDAAHLSRLARWMHHTTGGSPLFCTELTRHMVEAEIVRYDEGSWILPEEVTQTGVPDGLAAAMRQRVSGLSANTRAVAEVLVVHGSDADLERTMMLLEPLLSEQDRENDHAELIFGALAELVQQGVLADSGEQVRFRHDSLREALLGGIEPERRRRLHRHVGRVLLEAGVGDDPAAEAEVGWHLFRGGDEDRGAAMLERAGRRLYDAQALADCIAPLETALEVRERQGAPDAVIGDLSYMLLTAGWVSNREVGSRHSERPVDIYANLGGLGTARRLKPWMGWRLAFLFALLWAGLRWLFRFGEARGPGPIRALGLFAIGLTNATAIAYSENQKEKVRRLVARADPLLAFRGHPPYLAYLALHAMTDILVGRLESAGDRLTEANRLANRRLFNPLDENEKRLVDAAMRAIRLLVDVNQFNPRIYDDLEAIDASGLVYYRHCAESVRAVRHRYRGEEAKARALEAQMEPTSLQLGAWSLDLQRLLFAHPAYAFTHDVEGLKRSLDGLERRIAEGMELSVRVAITRAEILRERGDYDAALAILEPLLKRLDADDHLMRQFGASAAAQTALEAYDYERAVNHAQLGLDDGADPAVRVLFPWLRCQRVMGLAEDALGRSGEAAMRLERAIEIAESHDCPVLAGELHEARARVAFATGDRLLFEVHRAKCAAWLRPTENPGLIAVVERLVELDRIDRDASLPQVDPRRRRPGVSTEASATSEGTADSDPDSGDMATASRIIEVDHTLATASRIYEVSETRPPPERSKGVTAASTPRGSGGDSWDSGERSAEMTFEEDRDATAAASPRALGHHDKTDLDDPE
jgi:hypothetical protein